MADTISLYKPLVGKKAFRLLEIFPDEAISEEEHGYIIKGSMHHSDLGLPSSHETTDYITLSHMLCDGSPVRITNNLHLALRRIRELLDSEWGIRTGNKRMLVWIDALCIDQGNMDERAQQVQLMANIYGNAAKLLIWLGRTPVKDRFAIETVVKACNRDPCTDMDPAVLNARKEIEIGLLAIFALPWFSRRWILQEVFSTKPNAHYMLLGPHAWPMIRLVQLTRALFDVLVTVKTPQVMGYERFQ